MRLIVACHAGIGTSQLLMEKLKKHFHFQIIDIVSSHEAGNLKEGQADLLYEKVPEEAGTLMPKVEEIVNGYFTRSQEKDPYTPGISQLLPASHIQLDIECVTWQEAIRASAERLLELGYIEPCYVEAMIRNVEENGPYIVLVKGFAVPHEGIDKGVKKTGMNLIRLKEPVNFDAEENDPVKFVCCMSAADHQTHLKAFFHLVNLLRNPEFLSDLEKCSTPEEAALRIRYYEEKTDKEGWS